MGVSGSWISESKVEVAAASLSVMVVNSQFPRLSLLDVRKIV